MANTPADTGIVDCTEQKRLNDARKAAILWKKWGPYRSERQWGTVHEQVGGNQAETRGITTGNCRNATGMTP